MPAASPSSPPSIPAREHASRRRKLATALRGAVGLVFAGDHDPHVGGKRFRPHPHFEYLAGVTDEPGAVLLLDPGHPSAARREILLLRPLDPELEQWDGLRDEIGSALRERTGFKTIHRLRALPRLLGEAAQRARSLACLHPLAWHDQPLSPDLALFRKIAERVPGVEIEDRSHAVAGLRAVKSKAEVAMIQHAIDVTALGFDAVLRAVRPGWSEFDVQETLEHAYRTNGSRGPAFDTIAGAGLNSTVLHYGANDRTIGDEDLICVDSGASHGGYGADVTRTIPASGRFTPRQREVYEVVLKAQEAAIRAVKPGATLGEIDAVARKVIADAGFGDAFIHSIGHHLGLETHDAAPPAAPLKAGAVVTIEPGVYLPDEAIGVRIEDDVLVTKEGRRNLSSRIPKSVEAVEAAMAGA